MSRPITIDHSYRILCRYCEETGDVTLHAALNERMLAARDRSFIFLAAAVRSFARQRQTSALAQIRHRKPILPRSNDLTSIS